MKTVLLLRHAKSSWANARLADFDRPLNGRGERDAPRIGRLLRREDLVPDLIVSSAAERAMQTAELVALAAGYEGDLRFSRDLYHADPETYLEVAARAPDDVARLMLVGHNPGMEELVEALTGAWERMPTAALAQITLPVTRWREVGDGTQGQLVNLWRPKEMPAEGR